MTAIPTPAERPAASAEDASYRAMLRSLRAMQLPSVSRSAWQLGSTLLALLCVYAGLFGALHLSAWLALALACPAAGLMVRLFIIQHDCGHGSFFRTRRLNDAVGRACSMLTFTPYAFWRRQHANHHGCFNNLDRREPGIDLYSGCATLQEYRALSPRQRLLYRVSRHPLVAQFLLPPLVFLLLYRVPFDAPKSWTRERASVYLTDVMIACVLGLGAYFFGLWQVLFVQVSVLSITAIIGVWLFTIQHRFEASQWMRQDDWSASGAALEGSSYLRLPAVLQWFTGNIGFHHVHHLAPRVPNYRLQAAHRAHAELAAVPTLTIWQALLAPAYLLWDEERERMVPFPAR